MAKNDTITPVTLYTRLLEAWNKRDARAFAALFAVDGNVVGFDGSPMNGRDQIGAALEAIFDHHQTASYVAKVREVRSLAPGVTLLRAVVGMVPPGSAGLNPNVNAVQSAVLVQEDGEWRIALFQNTPAAFHGRPEMVEQLTEELRQVVRSGQVVLERTV